MHAGDKMTKTFYSNFTFADERYKKDRNFSLRSVRNVA